MSKQADDLEAVRTLVETLASFDGTDQERIIRWAREKLGLSGVPDAPPAHRPELRADIADTRRPVGEPEGKGADIKTFIAQKKPTSNTHFAATVAYYYRFEAPESDRKDSITSADLQDACRKAQRARLNDPGQTLRDALKTGLLDKTEPGVFTINSVGENLVAMILPSGGKRAYAPKRGVKKKRKKVKRPTHKRTPGK